MGAGDLTPVSVGVVFERFPASVRGALVVRGADPDPHQVSLLEASLVEAAAPTRPVRSLDLGSVTVDVAPRGEVLIPFEVPFASLDPGWYAIAAEVLVDGQVRLRGPEGTSPRFAIGWPAGTVRRGSIDLGLPIRVPGSEGVLVERLECRADSSLVRWRHAPGDESGRPEFERLTVRVGRRRLPLLDDAFDPRSGRRTTTFYPLMKRHGKVTFELDRRAAKGKARRGRWSATAELD